MPVTNYYRPYDSVAEAFDKGYDIGKDKEDGDPTIDSGAINQVIHRLIATQEKFGRQDILSKMIKELFALAATVQEYERSEQERSEQEREDELPPEYP